METGLEIELEEALILMVEQYLDEVSPNVYDTQCMLAGESALKVLEKTGAAINVTNKLYHNGGPIYRLMKLVYK